MRIDKTYYELMQIEQKYMEKGSPLPTFIQQEYQITLLIDNAWRTLNRYSSGKAIPKSGWEWMESICNTIIPNCISNNLKNNLEQCISEVKNLKDDFLFSKNMLLDDGHTLTKEGRKRLHQCCVNIGKLPLKRENLFLLDEL